MISYCFVFGLLNGLLVNAVVSAYFRYEAYPALSILAVTCFLGILQGLLYQLGILDPAGGGGGGTTGSLVSSRSDQLAYGASADSLFNRLQTLQQQEQQQEQHQQQATRVTGTLVLPPALLLERRHNNPPQPPSHHHHNRSHHHHHHSSPPTDLREEDRLAEHEQLVRAGGLGGVGGAAGAVAGKPLQTRESSIVEGLPLTAPSQNGGRRRSPHTQLTSTNPAKQPPFPHHSTNEFAGTMSTFFSATNESMTAPLLASSGPLPDQHHIPRSSESAGGTHSDFDTTATTLLVGDGQLSSRISLAASTFSTSSEFNGNQKISLDEESDTMALLPHEASPRARRSASPPPPLALPAASTAVVTPPASSSTLVSALHNKTSYPRRRNVRNNNNGARSLTVDTESNIIIAPQSTPQPITAPTTTSFSTEIDYIAALLTPQSSSVHGSLSASTSSGRSSSTTNTATSTTRNSGMEPKPKACAAISTPVLQVLASSHRYGGPRPLHFLVVDPNAVHQRTLMRLLTSQFPGASASCCAWSAQCVRFVGILCRRFRVVVFYDIGSVDGTSAETSLIEEAAEIENEGKHFDLVDRLRVTYDPEELQLIGITDHFSAMTRDRCLSHGMFELLAKPISRELLHRSVNRLLRHIWECVPIASSSSPCPNSSSFSHVNQNPLTTANEDESPMTPPLGAATLPLPTSATTTASVTLPNTASVASPSVPDPRVS